MKIGKSLKAVRTYQDLHVYQNLFQAMLKVHREIIPLLPKEEQFDLCSQMRRASKAAPALLAEGFAKRYHKRYWQKYLTDAMGESNEMIHHLTVASTLYGRPEYSNIFDTAIDLYDKSCRQLTKLAQSWRDFLIKK